MRSRLIHIGAAASPVGVIPFGAADGMRRLAPDTGAVALLNGQRVPILGVSLEYTNLDLRGVDARVGDEVVLIGASGSDAISLNEVGVWWHADPVHALVALSPNIPRILS